jgi:hypothetical protein
MRQVIVRLHLGFAQDFPLHLHVGQALQGLLERDDGARMLNAHLRIVGRLSLLVLRRFRRLGILDADQFAIEHVENSFDHVVHPSLRNIVGRHANPVIRMRGGDRLSVGPLGLFHDAHNFGDVTEMEIAACRFKGRAKIFFDASRAAISVCVSNDKRVCVGAMNNFTSDAIANGRRNYSEQAGV